MTAAKRLGWARALVAIGAVAILPAGPGTALEDVKILVPGATRDVARAIENASLLVSSRRDGVTDPVDLLAAAKADYARIVGALYSEGYYGGTVSILVDGREAADISPLAAPSRIDRIVGRVTPGPLYRFNRADIGPLIYGTVLPEGYATGQPAEADQIRRAVNASVDPAFPDFATSGGRSRPLA